MELLEPRLLLSCVVQGGRRSVTLLCDEAADVLHITDLGKGSFIIEHNGMTQSIASNARSLVVRTGAGDDHVTYHAAGDEVIRKYLLDLGAGDDFADYDAMDDVRIPKRGSVSIHGGSGNDHVDFCYDVTLERVTNINLLMGSGDDVLDILASYKAVVPPVGKSITVGFDATVDGGPGQDVVTTNQGYMTETGFEEIR